jgi:flagellar biosynthesis protein FliR
MMQLYEPLMQLQGIGQDLAWRYWLVFLRVGAALSLMPAFGEQSVPQRVKLVVALAFTMIVAPGAGEMPPYDNAPMAAMGAEVVIGLALGLALRLMVMALQIAGTIAANATSLAQLFGGAGPEPQPALSNLWVMAGLALVLATGLHVHMAQAFIQSYQVFSAGQAPQAADMAHWGMNHIAAAFAMAFVLAAPFTLAAFLYNVALGIINRALPALMVSFIGAPALAGGGLLMIAVVSPLLLSVWLGQFNRLLQAPFAALP